MPDFELGSDIVRRYGVSNAEMFSQSDKLIKTVSEGGEENSVSSIKSAISESDKLIFIGFGFGEENLKLFIRPGNLRAATAVYATAYGMQEYQKFTLINRLRIVVGQGTAPEKRIKEFADDCNDLFTKFGSELI